jgi:hypothetical protein
MIPSYRGIGLFRGKLINLCGKITQISMSTHGTSIEEEFEVVKFIENNAPFAILLGKTWIERDHARKKEEEVLEQKKQELKFFMTRRITHLIEEHENISKLFNTKDLDVEFGRTQEDPQKTEVPTPDKEEVLPLNPSKESQQCKVTMPKEDKNQNGKRNTETELTGRKARKLSKKRSKIEKLQKVPEGKFAKLELRWDIRIASHGTLPWKRNIVVGNSIAIRPTPQMGRMTFMVRQLAIKPLGPRRNRHNYSNEGFSPVGEIFCLVIYLFH